MQDSIKKCLKHSIFFQIGPKKNVLFLLFLPKIQEEDLSKNTSNKEIKEVQNILWKKPQKESQIRKLNFKLIIQIIGQEY